MNQLSTRLKGKDLSGNLLLAHPDLKDPNFKQSVIAVARYQATIGAMGLVVNKPLRLTLGDFDEKKWVDLEEIPVYEGGPVEKDRIILTGVDWNKHTRWFKWYLGLTRAMAIDLLRKNPSLDLRAFCGYAGWGLGQLENEVQKNAWIPTPMAPQVIFSSASQTLWLDLMIRFHPTIALWHSLPKDPSLN